MKKWPPKDPDEVLDYEIDWSDPDAPRLATGDTIASSTWLAGDPLSQTWPAETGWLVKDSDTTTTTKSIIWLSGGTLGETYALTCRITTAQGRTHDCSVKLQIKAK